MPATPPASDSRVAYQLEYSVTEGPELGTDLTETRTVLELDRSLRTAHLEQHRTPLDRGGEPIGTFHQQLAEATFARVLDLAEQANLATLPAATGGGPGASLFLLRLTRGDNVTEATFTSRDIPILAQLGALLTALDEIGFDLHEHPMQAISATVAYEQGTFQLRLQNIGTEPLCLANPRGLGCDEDDRWAGVRIAEFPPEVPGFTAPPLEWSRLGLVPATKDAPGSATLLLAPGQAITFAALPWQPATKGLRHLVQGVISSYGGPPRLNNCYHLRGAVISAEIEVTP